MGNFSRDTFDKLKHYVGVRLQQGVPLVDADWNEMEDIRKHEIEEFLKWYVNNGVIRKDDFKITPSDKPNNFKIMRGACLVDGWVAQAEEDMNYFDQPLHDNMELAALWGVPNIEKMETPTDSITYLVYLDIWEREVNHEEDAGLVNPLINVPTCVRRKREWAVRLHDVGANPQPVPQQGHVFYTLALIHRDPEEQYIKDGDVTDCRSVIQTVEGLMQTVEGHDHSEGKRIASSGLEDGAVQVCKTDMEEIDSGISDKFIGDQTFSIVVGTAGHEHGRSSPDFIFARVVLWPEYPRLVTEIMEPLPTLTYRVVHRLGIGMPALKVELEITTANMNVIDGDPIGYRVHWWLYGWRSRPPQSGSVKTETQVLCTMTHVYQLIVIAQVRTLTPCDAYFKGFVSFKVTVVWAEGAPGWEPGHVLYDERVNVDGYGRAQSQVISLAEVHGVCTLRVQATSELEDPHMGSVAVVTHQYDTY